MNLARRIAEDLATTLSFFTRLPAGRLAPWPHDWSLSRAVWCWPLAGVLIGALTGAGATLLSLVGVPLLLAALWACALQLLLTGGLHEDGLADCADSLGAHTPETRLRIMKDSRIGTFGSAALLLLLGLRIAAIAILLQRGAAGLIAGLIAANALARGGLPVLLILGAPARNEGLAQRLGRIPKAALVPPLAIAGLVVAEIMPVQTACACLIATGCAAILAPSLTKKRYGGYTGDTLGALACIIEALTLTVFLST